MTYIRSSIEGGLFIPEGYQYSLRRTQAQRKEENAWDKIYRQMSENLETKPYPFFQHVKKNLKDRGVKSVMDLACGATARHAAELLEDGYEVGVSDLSATAISMTEMSLRMRDVDVDNLKLNGQFSASVFDMFELPWPVKRRYDAVVAIQSIYHALRREIVDGVKYIHDEVLNNKGSFIFTVSMNPLRPLRGYEFRGDEESSELFDIPEPFTFIPRHGEEAGLPHHYFANPYDNFAVRSQVVEMLENVGFPIVQTHIDDRSQYLIVDARKNGGL